MQRNTFRHALVTGGCGFIGHHLVHTLLNRGTRVTVLDDLSTGLRSNLPHHPDLEFIEGSVLDRSAVRRAVRGADIVYHLASMVGMRRVDRDPEGAYRISIDGTRAVLDMSGELPIVAYSSSSVYGLGTQGRVSEEDAEDGARALAYDGDRRGYAMGKWDMERLVLAEQDHRPVLVLRPFNVIGEAQSANYGMVLPRFLSQALSGAPLTVYDDGKQQRCFSCVRCFVDRVARLAEHPGAWEVPDHVLNIGCDQPTEIGELARIVLEETGSSSKIQRVPYQKIYPGRTDVRWRAPNLDRVQSLLGREAWPDVRSLVRRLVVDAGEQRRLERIGA